MAADIRTFRAASMQAALDIVRAELGDDAVILHTRQVDKRGLLPFLGGRKEVEITAGPPNRKAAAMSSSTIASRASEHETLAPPPQLLAGVGAESGSARPVAVAEKRSVAESRVHGNGQHTVQPPRWSPQDVIVDVPARRSTPPAPHSLRQARTPATPSQRYTIARASEDLPAAPPRQRLATATPAPRPATNTPETAANSLHQRIDQLQQMILELGRERESTSLHDIPNELFQLYTQLIDMEVDELLARELVCKAKSLATKSQLASPAAMQSLLTALVEQELNPGTPLTAARGRQRVVAVVGPTGVGKTTTLAKLAANLRLREGLKVGLITVDTYRIAAVEQLKTYAELIDLPMQVVTSPEEMRRAVSEFHGLDVVLIDTAGRSPRDEPRIRELKACLDAAQADEVYLVLSLASGLPALETVATNFRPVGVTSLILTKLDESAAAGLLLQIARQFRLPVSYLTTGQNVPDDIEPAQRTRMARLVLGLDRVGA